MNESRTCAGGDTDLTPPRSGFDLEETRRGLIALRVKHGAESAIGQRCSNIVELLQNLDKAESAQAIVELRRNIVKQMDGLNRLLTAA